MGALLSFIGGPLLSFLGGPVVSGLVASYKAKLDSVNSQDAHAIDLAKADLLAQIEARKEATILAGNKMASLIQFLCGLIIVIYFGKCLVWDKVLGWGETDPIRDQNLATWSNLIITFYFGGNIVSGVVSVVARRFAK